LTERVTSLLKTIQIQINSLLKAQNAFQ
jgi:hypothetical protein